MLTTRIALNQINQLLQELAIENEIIISEDKSNNHMIEEIENTGIKVI